MQAEPPSGTNEVPRLLITGGTGFIGSRLAATARRQGHAVTVLGLAGTPAEARNAAAMRADGIEVALAPLADLGTVRPLLDGCGIVCHLAAAQHETDVPDQHYWEVNLRGTERLLDACVAAGVGRFVHGGTMGVYGRQSGVLDETAAPRPDSLYGRTKLAAERAVLARGDDLPVVVVRIAEAYGPGDPRLLKLFRGLERGWFPLLGDGRNRHPLIHVDDVVDGLLLAGRHPAAVGEVLDLVGEEQPTTEELIAAAAAALGRPGPRLRLPLAPFLLVAMLSERTLPPLGLKPPLNRRRLDFFRRSLQLSGAKAYGLLGFVPRIGVADGCRQTVAWYRANGQL